MKRILIIFALLFPLLVAGQGKVYSKYASRPDLAVAQVSGFHLNDKERVEVVLITADDHKAWQKLAAEFGLKEEANGANKVTSWLGDPEHPERHVRWSGKPVVRVVASPARRTIGLYFITTEAEYDALVDYQMEVMKTKKETKRR